MATVQVEEMLTAEQVAGLFHFSAQTITGWVSKGKIPRPIRVGRRCLFDAAIIREHVEKLFKGKGPK